ncbi:MAG TPA: putative glycoside hydrolase, partial [Longimicrobiaceae bacterium]|nr:putative glycoside hydrolase [Longimicrobiaceae bacterium]
MKHPLYARLSLAALLLVAASSCGEGNSNIGANESLPYSAADTLAAETDTVPAAPVVATAPRERAPGQIRGLYLNAYASGSRTRLPRLLAVAETTEINAFVIDVKDERGIRYDTGIELARELALDGEVTIRDLAALADTLEAHGVYAIARIVVFNDPILSEARPEWSIRRPDGSVWLDRSGRSWVSPWDERVWDYNISIAEEVARAGFDEIQFDYVRFPEQFQSLPLQVHPHARGDRADAIIAFLTEAKRRLHPLGVTVAADVFGLSPNTYTDVEIGQQWEKTSAVADHILPMLYPSHYYAT